MIIKEWNHDQLKIDFPNASNLDSILDAINGEANTAGRFLFGVEINGLPLTEEQEESLGRSPVDQIVSLKVSQADRAELFSESLQGLEEYSQKLAGAFEKASVLFRGADIPKAAQFCEKTILLTQGFVEMLNNFKVVYGSEFGLISSAWSRQELQTLKLLDECLSAFKRMDYLLVADIMEYELTAVAEGWGQLVQGLGQRKSETENTIR
ncbi:MAG: hypothetical protein IT289_11950 [Oligoflexia bacterium]|nr:hypothetical protein [Oligoflexia bacterium]